jgi:Holliday junction resolvasome RuvABC DNA-binding subunit
MTIPRIGKKNAQKIIIELKTKLGSLEELDLSQAGGETQDIVEALQAVGFSRQEAIEAVRHLPEGLDSPEEKIRHALKNMKGLTNG